LLNIDSTVHISKQYKKCKEEKKKKTLEAYDELSNVQVLKTFCIEWKAY